MMTPLAVSMHPQQNLQGQLQLLKTSAAALTEPKALATYLMLVIRMQLAFKLLQLLLPLDVKQQQPLSIPLTLS